MEQETKYRGIVKVAVFLLLAILLGLFYRKNINLREQLQDQEVELVSSNRELGMSKNEVVLLKSGLTQDPLIREVIKEVPRDRIKYITRVKTKVISSDPVYVSELPKEYYFKTKDSLVVASIIPDNDSYALDTYDLNIVTETAILDNRTVTSTTISSSYDPEFVVRLPSKVQTFSLPPKKIFSPTVGLGTGLELPSFEPQVLLWNTNVHLGSFDLLGLSVSGTSDSFGFGFVPLAYNLGSPLPVLDNLWLGSDLHYSLANKQQASLFIGAKL